jgi:hypothetical protein
MGGGRVQALIDSDTFRGQTPSSLFRPRKAVTQIDPLLDAYHLAGQAGKLNALDALRVEVLQYIASKGGDAAQDDRTNAVRTLRNAIVIERPRAARVSRLAPFGVAATVGDVHVADGLGDVELDALAALGQVTTVQQLVALHALPRADAEIIQLANLPQADSHPRLQTLAAAPRPTAEILQLADLAGAGLGGVTVANPPTAGELAALVTRDTSIGDYTLAMGSGAVHSAAQLEELARTGRIQAALDALGPSGAEAWMYYVPMNLHYGLAENNRNVHLWKANYGSVYAITGASERLEDAARSNTILLALIAAGTLRGGTVQVPGFLADELEARWLDEHTGARGIHYQGSDRGNDQKAD